MIRRWGRHWFIRAYPRSERQMKRHSNNLGAGPQLTFGSGPAAHTHVAGTLPEGSRTTFREFEVEVPLPRWFG